MELWFTERHTNNAQFSIRVDRQLFSAASPFQQIDVFESEEFGRFLVIDGFMMLTERDEFIYHEMIVHPAMAVHPGARDVLIIGGGDGGTARELARYGGIRRIDVVEIDAAVVKACREFLPGTSCGFDDGRVTVHYEDGVRFVGRCTDAYDLIIVDSTDPIGPGEGLFTKSFYAGCHRALRADGILINQHESPFYTEDAAAMSRAHTNISGCFPISRVYQAHIPTYPSGHWLFGFASKGRHPIKDLDAGGWNSLGLDTRYYNTSLHGGAFALPTYVRALLRAATGQA